MCESEFMSLLWVSLCGGISTDGIFCLNGYLPLSQTGDGGDADAPVIFLLPFAVTLILYVGACVCGRVWVSR